MMLKKISIRKQLKLYNRIHINYSSFVMILLLILFIKLN